MFMQYSIYKLSQLRFHSRLGDGVPEMRFERMTMGPTSRDIQGPKVQGEFCLHSVGPELATF
jgi:hypothetical protein